MVRLKDHVAIVTGAASGIGRAIACKFANEGARVVVADTRDTPINGGPNTVDVIKQDGGTALFAETDVSQWEQVDQMVRQTVDQFGRLDVIVNGAAIFPRHNVLETTVDEWDAVMAVNLRGMFICCKRAIQQMMEQEPRNEVRGRVINITSQHGMVGPPEMCAYATSKGGAINLTRQLAVDYVRHGILINAVAPGPILTGTHPDDTSGSPLRDYARSRTPYPRLGRPEDVAGATAYLASEEASFVSGINLLVDGGWMAY
jgi:glucose 1-dehydrogenase